MCKYESKWNFWRYWIAVIIKVRMCMYTCTQGFGWFFSTSERSFMLIISSKPPPPNPNPWPLTLSLISLLLIRYLVRIAVTMSDFSGADHSNWRTVALDMLKEEWHFFGVDLFYMIDNRDSSIYNEINLRDKKVVFYLIKNYKCMYITDISLMSHCKWKCIVKMYSIKLRWQ